MQSRRQRQHSRGASGNNLSRGSPGPTSETPAKKYLELSAWLTQGGSSCKKSQTMQQDSSRNRNKASARMAESDAAPAAAHVNLKF